MALSKEELLKIAKLAKISINENEIEKFKTELNDILKYIDMLNEVDTENVPPLLSVNNEINNFRENEKLDSLPLEKVFLNVPNYVEDTIVVPKVIEE